MDLPATDDASELEKWLLGQLGATEEGFQADGSVIICALSNSLERAMEASFLRLRVMLAEKKGVRYDARILRLIDDRLLVCVRALKSQAPPAGQFLEQDPTEKLRVNLELPHYRVHKSRSEGERELIELCGSTDPEEAFVFLLYDSGQEEWAECGLAEASETANVDVGALRQIFTSPAGIKRISFYHHHPIEREGNNDNSQTPSEKDVEGFVQLLGMLATEFPHLLDRADFRVITSTGIYLFRVSPKVTTDKNARLQVLRIASAIEKERTATQAYWYSNLQNFARENGKFAGKFDSSVIRITFTAREIPQITLRTTDASKQGFTVRDAEGIPYEVYYNAERKQIILKNPTEPVLYDEKGIRIGYAGPAGEWVLGVPPKGWPPKFKTRIQLEIYKETEARLLRIKMVEKP